MKRFTIPIVALMMLVSFICWTGDCMRELPRSLLAGLQVVLRKSYRANLCEPRRERLLLASLSFFLAFGTVRVITHVIRAGVGPLHNVVRGGQHIHHLVWGILLLLIVGFLWVAQIGTGMRDSSFWVGRITTLLFGVGAALTLDEFALWLNLADVYWLPQGRASIQAALFFGGLLSVGVWGGPFFALVHTAVWRSLGRDRAEYPASQQIPQTSSRCDGKR